MVLGEEDHDGHLEKGLLLYGGVRHLEARQAIVQPRLLEGPDLLGGVHLQDLHRLPQPPAQVVQKGHEVGEEVLRHPKAQAFPPRPAHPFLQGLHLPQKGFPFPGQGLPRRGQAEGAALQEPHPQLPL